MGLLVWLGSAFASALGYSAVRFVAWKLVVYSIVTVVVPIILINVIYSLIEGAMSLATTAQNEYGLSPILVQLTGLGAWFAVYLKIPEGFSLLMSAIMFRVAIRMIPFIRL